MKRNLLGALLITSLTLPAGGAFAQDFVPSYDPSVAPPSDQIIFPTVDPLPPPTPFQVLESGGIPTYENSQSSEGPMFPLNDSIGFSVTPFSDTQIEVESNF